MRFRSLHLTRFGCFTDQLIEFGPASEMPDFQIIYGDNEAGKSTLRDAITAFLYGIPTRTEYNFLHDYKALQIGADLDVSQGSLSAIRIKANRESLRTPDNAVLSEDTLKRELLGLSESDFVDLFSLDLRALLEGGANILQAKGDLGALLFAGASGISSISQTIDRAREKANAFFKPRASSSQLAKRKKRLNDIDSELKSIDVHAPEFRRLKRAATDAAGAYREAAKSLKGDRSSYEKQKHILQALDPWRELKGLQARLEKLGKLPAADEDALVRARALETELRALQDVKSGLENELLHAEERLNSQQPPKYQDRLLAGLEALQIDKLEARASTARLDLPSRDKELGDLNRQISGKLGRLGLDPDSDPEAHLISKSDAARIVMLANTGESLATEHAGAASELENAASLVNLARDDLSVLPEPQDFAALEDALSTCRRDLDLDNLRETETAVADAQQRLDRALRELAPWTGAPGDLDSLDPPGFSELEGLEEQLNVLSRESNQLRSERRSLVRAIESAAAQLNELESDPEIVSDQEAADLLGERDELWRKHDQSIEGGVIDNIQASADAFETSMRGYDLALSKRLARASDLGEIKSLRLRRKGAEAEWELIEASISEANDALENVRDEVARHAATLGLPASTSIVELKAWLQARERALDEWSTRDSRATTLGARESRFTNAASVLRNVLENAGVTNSGGDDTILAACERTLLTLRTDREAYKLAKAKYDTLARQKTQREATAKAAQSAYDSWQVEWSDALTQLSLENEAPAAIKARLEDLAELSVKTDDRQKLLRRISLMKTSLSDFSDAIAQLADSTGIGDRNADASECFAALKAEASDLQKRDVQREALEAQIDKDRATLQSKAEKLNALTDEAGALCKRYRADALTDCIDILKSAGAAKTLSDQAAALRSQISRLLANNDESTWSDSLSPLTESSDALAAAEADARDAEMQIDMEEKHVRELYAEWKAAERVRDEIGDDASAARLQQERATLLEDIKLGANSYVSLKAGALIIDEAVRLFRDQHRGTMLQQASDAFSTMTIGRYPRLVTTTDNDHEILVAERHDRTTLSADSLSTGTRAQLYLALRIAGHAQYAKSNTPLPFIADDILEEFDDHRAKETLLLMAKMAETGQVIYLTHHQHLVEMAQEIGAERCTVHRLNRTASNFAESAS